MAAPNAPQGNLAAGHQINRQNVGGYVGTTGYKIVNHIDQRPIPVKPFLLLSVLSHHVLPFSEEKIKQPYRLDFLGPMPEQYVVDSN